MAPTHSWRLSAVLPGLQLSHSIECGPFAAITPNDNRYNSLANDPRSTPIFLSRFRSPYGKKVKPTLIVNRLKAQQYKALLVTDFRNLIAVCCQMRGFAYRYQSNPKSSGPVFSDFFDIYPGWPRDGGDEWPTDSVFIRGAMQSKPPIEIRRFNGGLPLGIFDQTNRMAIPDVHLLHALTKLFSDQSGKFSSIRRRVFRALEVVRLATRAPIGNLGSQQDYGLSFAQWVSAIEILTHLMICGTNTRPNVNANEVVNVIEAIPWKDQKLRRKSVRWSKKIGSGNSVNTRIRKAEQIYRRMYKVRCDYLHGNTIIGRAVERYWQPSRGHLSGQAPILFRWYLLKILSHFGFTNYLNPISIIDQSTLRNLSDDVNIYEWPLYGNAPEI
jgi:hypothetical protein